MEAPDIPEGADDDLYLRPPLLVTARMSDVAARKFGLKAADIEKDYHITRLLVGLCQPLPDHPQVQVVLGGGTGLAKRGVTERFSEDVDITLTVPELSGYSNSQVRSWLRAMRLRAKPLAIGAQMTHKGGSSYRSFVIPYRSGVGTTTSFARIQCDIKIADAEGRQADMIEVESLITQAAPTLGNRKPDTTALCAHPVWTLADKLHALNRLCQAKDPAAVSVRSRDIYDLACIFLHCGDYLRPGDVAAAYEISNGSQKHRSGWDVPIPVDGLKSLPIWDQDSAHHRAAEKAFDEDVVPLMFDGCAMSYTECHNVIRSYRHLL